MRPVETLSPVLLRGELDNRSVCDATREESEQICGEVLSSCVQKDEQTPGLPESDSNLFF